MRSPSVTVNGLVKAMQTLTGYLESKHCRIAYDYVTNVKATPSRSQQKELKSTLLQSFRWSRRWGLPLNTSKSQRMSIIGLSVLRKEHSDEVGGESILSCKQLNYLGIPSLEFEEFFREAF